MNCGHLMDWNGQLKKNTVVKLLKLLKQTAGILFAFLKDTVTSLCVVSNIPDYLQN